MKRVINVIKNNTIGFIIGLVIAGGIGVYAVSVASTEVTYDNSTSGSSATTVKAAIDDLYSRTITNSNIKHIPKMTSNTSNVGEAIGSSLFQNRQYYWAFDQSSSDWSGTESTGGWVGFDFKKAVLVQSANITYQSTYLAKFKFQGSNDLSSWVDLTTEINKGSGTDVINETYDLDTTNKYRYYRVYCTQSNAGSWTKVIELQFFYTE